MDDWTVTIPARRSLLETFEQFDDAQWEQRSLCGEWSMREVLAHLILAARPPLRRYLITAIRERSGFDRVNHLLAVDDARRPVDQLIADYRAVLDHRFSPPGWPSAAPLADILIHTLDVRLPLGIATDEPPAHFEPVMELLLGRLGRNFTAAGRPDVTWVAVDAGRSFGTGPRVEGRIADLALTAAGRDARLDVLEGPGVGLVVAWLE